jgi:hypothetical protein
VIAYLACPYTPIKKSNEIGLSKPNTKEWEDKVKEERFNKVNAVAAKLMKVGFTVISPLTSSHLLHRDHGLGGDWEFWKHHDFNLISCCHMIFVLTIEGWKESTGVKEEIVFGRRKGIPVFGINESLQLEVV